MASIVQSIDRWRLLKWLVLMSLSAVILLKLCTIYHPFFADDAFISLRYSERLLEGKGLTWNDGEHVEGYSNLLWVLLVSCGGMFSGNLLWVARVLCFAGTLTACAAVIFFARWEKVHALAEITALLFLISARPVVVWSSGGLESSLHMALVTWIAAIGWVHFRVAPLKHGRWLLGLLMGLIVINRPDGVYFVIIYSLLFAWLATKRKFPDIIAAAAVGVAFLLAQTLFRLGYYGELLPNTFYAKVAFNLQRLHEGLSYVKRGLFLYYPLLIGLMLLWYLGYAQARRHLPLSIYLLAPVILWFIAVAVAGGDIFPAYRHLVPVMGLFMLLVMISVDAALSKSVLLTVIIVALAWLGCNHVQQSDGEIRRAIAETWEWKCKVIGERLKQIFTADQPVVAVTAAGAIPYYSELPTLDMLGLNDSYLTKHKPQGFGHGYIGHELFNLQYVLRRKPGIIIFRCGDSGEAPPEVRDAYQSRWMTLPIGKASIWIRKDDTALLQHFDGANL